MNKHVSIYIILFLSLTLSVSAVTINSVSVTNPDVFFSSVDGNNKAYLVVNVTGANSSESAIDVTADFFAFNANCAGSGTSVIRLDKQSEDIWIGTCDLGDEAGALTPNTFKDEKIIIKANDSLNPTGSGTSDFTIAIYNVGIPTGNSCYQFVEPSTNFNTETNFNNIDLKLVIQANDDSACLSSGYNWNTGWLTVGELTFDGVNFRNNVVDAKKIIQLSDIVKLKFASSGTFQNNRLTIDTIQLPELSNVTSLNVKLYHLSLISPTIDFILSDNYVLPPSSLTYWTPNGFDTTMQNYTYNLDFTVGQNFKGFRITDNSTPIIISYSPSITTLPFNTTNVTFNALVNGTGTPVSKVLFILNGVSNNANCVVLNPEQSNCSLALTQTDGIYNLSIAAYDFGGEVGNAKIINLSYSVQTSPPVITPITPTSGATYTSVAGSMLKLKFTATDGNGISSCTYALTGPVTINTSTFTCVDNASVQLYLLTGTYNLLLSATDGSGMTTVSNISFTVTDMTAPVITNNSTNPTSNNAVLSVNTDESATCKYDTVDLPYADMRKTFKNNVSKHTVALELDKDKVYDYYVRCLDLSSNANKESLQVTLVYGTAPVENNTVVKVDPTDTYDLGTVPVGTKVVSIDKAGIPILSLIITTSKIADDVSLKLTTVSKPEETYSEKVYKYVTIEHAALSDDSITNVKIKFSVDKKWLTDNNINSSDVVLVRYGINGWTPLNTNLTRESDDGTEIFYLADSPGLSLFAISKNIPPVVPITPITTTDTLTNVTTNATTTDTELLQKRNINWFWVILLSIIVFVLIVLFVLVQKNDAENPPIFPEDRTPWGRVRRLFK